PRASARAGIVQVAADLAVAAARQVFAENDFARTFIKIEPLGAVAQQPGRSAITSASRTRGCARSTFSTSAGITRLAPTLIIALFLPATSRLPPPSKRPRSPVKR